MVVSEIGLLKLKEASMINDSELRSSLSEIKTWLKEFTGRPFHYLNGVEDSCEIYLVGEWQSLEQHYQDMHNNEKWKKTVIEMSQKYFDFQWMCHYDFSMSDVQLGAPVLSIGRHFVSKEKRTDFIQFFAKHKRYLDEYVTEGTVVGGWRVDEGNSTKGSSLDQHKELDEFVLLAPWQDVQQHKSFTESDGFKEYAKIKDLIIDADIKHAHLLKDI